MSESVYQIEKCNQSVAYDKVIRLEWQRSHDEIIAAFDQGNNWHECNSVNYESC